MSEALHTLQQQAADAARTALRAHEAAQEERVTQVAAATDGGEAAPAATAGGAPAADADAGRDAILRSMAARSDCPPMVKQAIAKAAGGQAATTAASSSAGAAAPAAQPQQPGAPTLSPEPDRVAFLEARVQQLEKRLLAVEGGQSGPVQQGQPLTPRLPLAGSGLVYVGMAADILHHGHVNIINVANSLGTVVVGLLTDEAIGSYKRKTVVTWEQRKKLVEALRGVEIVVPQNTLDYCLNLTWLRPAFVVHGADWSHPDSAQYATREKVREKLAEWNG